MKPALHPTYFDQATVKCACGNSWTTGATVKELDLDIGSNCDPFYTGTAKQLDARGRIEKFTRRTQKHQEHASKATVLKKPRIKKNSKP